MAIERQENYAGDLRERKMEEMRGQGGEGDDSANYNEDESGGLSLRERKMQEMKLKAKAAVNEEIKETAMSPVKAGTGQLLKLSWLNLIDSFGLTLIYINTHVFLRWIFPDMFCKLGEEWIPKQASVLKADENMKRTGQAIGIVEVMGLLLIDTVALFLILGILTFMYLLIDIYLNPIESIWTYGIAGVYDAIKALFK